MHVGATLRLLRTDAGLSLRQLAGRIGVSSAYLSRVENGHDAPPTGERLASIARELSVPPDLLVDVGDRLETSLRAYIEQEPAAGRLLLEIAQRRLTRAELGRIRAFIQKEFPRDGAAPPALSPLCALLPPERIVLQLSCADLEDALDVAAGRLCGRGEQPSARELAANLLAREDEAPTAVGRGVAIPRTFVGSWAPRMVLVTFANKVKVRTVDGAPLKALFVMVSPDRGAEHIARMAQVACLANRGIADELATVRSAPQARQVVAQLEAVAWNG